MVPELVAFLAASLVAEPERLEVVTHTNSRGVSVEIRCAPDDAGRLIGRGGRTINSIRTLARAASVGTRHGIRRSVAPGTAAIGAESPY